MYIIFQDFSYYYGFFPYIHGQIVSIYICWFCIYGCFSIAVTDEMGYTVKNKWEIDKRPVDLIAHLRNSSNQ